jgi:hypothetical protein
MFDGAKSRDRRLGMEWTGGCLCGAIRYRARTDPIRVVSCHCGMCRRASGAAFMTFVHFPASEFAWIGAQPTRYRSSDEAERGFCALCGSTLSMHEAVLPDRVQVSLGSLDRPDLVRPDDHVWTSSQLPWLNVVDHLPRFPTISDAVPSRAQGGDDER